MDVRLRQAGRKVRLVTVLGEDVLVLKGFSGTDYLNGLFTYRVDCLADRPDIEPDMLLGSHATIEMHAQGGLVYHDGIVTEVRCGGFGENGYDYTLLLRPWLFLSEMRRNHRIFKDQTVLEILHDLWAPYVDNFRAAFDMQVSRVCPKLEYTVQYGESDLAFATRLMERFGINYHFVHEMRQHTLTMVDTLEDVAPLAGVSRPYRSVDGDHQADEEHFSSWDRTQRVTTGALRLTDFNFKFPNAAMEVQAEGPVSHMASAIESFDYPGDFLRPETHSLSLETRLKRETGQAQRVRALGDVASLKAGQSVLVLGDEIPETTGNTFVCLEARHNFKAATYGSVRNTDYQKEFEGSFVLIRNSEPFAPEAKTPVPKMAGPQTAIVVGEGEIDCDKFGRILVRFHWDIANEVSMRCRVSQSWAGQGWGSVAIPRVGMEVVVEFIDGDPDKPLVTGCVYNAHTGMPYQLPANKTRLSIKSKSHQGAGYNELRFEDAGGEEEIFLHAQKDHNTVIENDETHRILNDRFKHVSNNQTESVGKNKSMSVGGDHSESITGKTTISIEKDFSTTVTKGNLYATVAEGNHVTTVKANQSARVEEGNRYVMVDKGGQATTVKGDVLTTSDEGSVVIKASQAIILEAPNIVLKSNDGNFISISQGTVVVEGAQTLINPRESAPKT